VTALYEWVPAGVEIDLAGVDDLKYQHPTAPSDASSSDELFTVKLRYKEPDGERSRLLEIPVEDGGASLASASDDFRFAAAVAAFGMILRDSEHIGDFTLADVSDLAAEGLGGDASGYRSQFVELVRQAASLRGASVTLR
jgi:Ca-activated chloride channel family protein